MHTRSWCGIFLQTLQYALCFFSTQMQPGVFPWRPQGSICAKKCSNWPKQKCPLKVLIQSDLTRLQKVYGTRPYREGNNDRKEQTSHPGSTGANRLLIAIGLLFIECISRSFTLNADLHLPMKPLTTTYLQCIYKLSKTCKMSNLRASV